MSTSRPQAPSRPATPGFTLVELLVTTAILVVLASLAIGVAGRIRAQARMVHAHSDLRQLAVAVQLYRNDHHGTCPPTRFSCAGGGDFLPPVELLEYGLPRGRDRWGGDTVALADPFREGATYCYRAVGPAIVNGTTMIEDGSRLWVPDGFPRCGAGGGRYFNDPRESPVLFAVWSLGPDPAAPKFDVPGRLPLPAKYWMHRAGEPGVVMHAQESAGELVLSR